MTSAEILLNSFCSNLLGESSKKETKTKSKNKKKENLKVVKNNSFKITADENFEQNCIQNEKFSADDIKQHGDLQVTDDGFKIISEIPPDDSDISDAFESDIEDSEVYTETTPTHNNNNNNKETEDGFKIISEIPADDSDVDDAFESDLDEEEWIKEAHTRVQANNNNNNNLKPELEKLKKPLLSLIQDFGMEDKIYLNENLKPTLKRSKFNVGNDKKNRKGKSRETFSDKELEVMDYSSKRGKKKKQIEKPPVEDKKKSKEEMEADMKKARYEIYKLGISSGTQGEKKQAKIDLVIKLGAKPQKNQRTNYKDLIKLRKEQKEEEKLKREEMKEMGMPVKKKPVIKEKDHFDINPRLGMFKGGVLKLSKQDIESINSSKNT